MSAWLRFVVVVVAIALVETACSTTESAQPEPLLVLESPGAKSTPTELVVVDLSGRELARETAGSGDVQALPSLHAATAQVAFWRGAPEGGYQLVAWNIATKTLKVVATHRLAPTSSPLWSANGSEIVSLNTSEPLSYVPGTTFEGTAEVSIATVATATTRTLNIEPFIPLYASAQSVSGTLISGETKFIAVDPRSGATLRRLPLPGVVGIIPTPNLDVIVVLRGTSTPGEVTVHVLNTTTGDEVAELGRGFASPILSWPGRSEITFLVGDELRAFDYGSKSTRAVGRLGEGVYPRAFDPSGTVLLVSRLLEPLQGTFTASGGRLTSQLRQIPLTGLVSPLGLVRVKL